mmetsp:Transcript_49113/g.158624  ORF Transcript_49113/g.158624 Transcript_49113/m.158624 type:complete len:226 (+) Transcript_49113:1065-1742(+)
MFSSILTRMVPTCWQLASPLEIRRADCAKISFEVASNAPRMACALSSTLAATFWAFCNAAFSSFSRCSASAAWNSSCAQRFLFASSRCKSMNVWLDSSFCWSTSLRWSTLVSSFEKWWSTFSSSLSRRCSIFASSLVCICDISCVTRLSMPRDSARKSLVFTMASRAAMILFSMSVTLFESSMLPVEPATAPNSMGVSRSTCCLGWLAALLLYIIMCPFRLMASC